MPEKAVVPPTQPWDITPEQNQAIKATDVTLDWLCRQSGDFFRPYAGRWIAAKDCRIIAAGQTMDELLSQLGDMDLQTVLVHRVERPGKVIYSCSSRSPG